MDLSKPCKHALANLADVRSEMFSAEDSSDKGGLKKTKAKYKKEFIKMLDDFGPEILEELLWGFQG